MASISMKQLLEVGAHFGHTTEKWHPKMKEFIYGSKNGIYIIDLRQTLQKLRDAYEYVKQISANGQKVLFVGTKFQGREILERESKKSNSFYVNLRWQGGTLTNFQTIKQSILKLKKYTEAAGEDFTYTGMLKKEAAKMEKSRRKMEAVLGGIKDMKKMPGAIFILDIRKESIALQEAKKMGIPVLAVVDTNCDPRGVDYVIPGNDDSIHSIDMFTSVISAAVLEGRKLYETKLREVKQEKEAKERDVKEAKEAKEAKVETKTEAGA